MVDDRSANPKNSSRVTFTELFVVFVASALVAGLAFEYFGVFRRFELQTINHRFEARQWIKWNPKSLGRLNPLSLIDYHEKNEIPKTWWSWDYTLSWLIGDNHPQPALKYVIFNRMLEDEPPQEAIKAHPWMKPLLSYPLPRETLSEMVNFVAASGARAIVLDFDFPQYTPGDKELARAIFKARLNIDAKPVYVANSIHSVTAGNISEIQQPVTRSGVIRELEQLEPGSDVVGKYTGLTGVLQDEDQIVRRLVLKLRLQDGKEYDALVVKLLRDLDIKLPGTTPEVIDIDFISVPGSEIFPIRPLSYLLDPELKAQISSGNGGDVSLKDAIVIIGDGLSDVYDTPLTNLGANRRSGSELLAQGLDTLARQSWLYRVTVAQEYIYIILMAIIGGINFVLFRYLSSPNRDGTDAQKPRGLAVGTDAILFIISLLSVYALANILFSYANMIVPLVVPGLAITLATVVTVLWERDRVKVIAMEQTIHSSQEKLILAQEKHEAQLAYQASLADQRAMEEDRARRHDMVRRLNHDLKAPVSVFNWTLAKVLKDRTEDDPMFAVFQRLKRSSEHLSNLLSEIVQSLAEEQSPDGQKTQICEITSVLIQQSELERSLAEITGSAVVLNLPDHSELTWVIGTELEVARIVDNIVGNALKHNPAGTKVEITLPSVNWSDDDLIVTIEDNGKGIAKDDLDRIFQSGYRVAGTRPEGQGLGLSIATSLCTKIGGKITVTSELDKGTKFEIVFRRYRSSLDATTDIRLDDIGFPYGKLTEDTQASKDDDWSSTPDDKPLDQPSPQSDQSDRSAQRSMPRS